jgi:hypothetical protein
MRVGAWLTAGSVERLLADDYNEPPFIICLNLVSREGCYRSAGDSV